MKRVAREKISSETNLNVEWGDVEVNEDLREMPIRQNIRLKILTGGLLIALFFGYIIWGLAKTQIVNGYVLYKRSLDNHLLSQEIYPDRGVIFDVNGRKIAENSRGYKLYMRTYLVDREEIIQEIKRLKDFFVFDEEDLLKLFDENSRNDKVYEVPAFTEITRDVSLKIKANQNQLQYFRLEEVPIRSYNVGPEFAHLLGYVGQVSEDEILNSGGTLTMGDSKGKDGIEYYYDNILRGKKGEKLIEVDSSNNKVAEYTDRQTDPVAGTSIYLSVDSLLQEKFYYMIEKKVNDIKGAGGSAIFMDVKTGKIKVLTNYPSYDINMFEGGITQDEYDEYNKLINDPGAPFLNRAISEAQPPGSTFKLVVASALLDSGSITPTTTFESNGVIYIGADNLQIQEYGKHSYGILDVRKAICKSSNIFFCRALMEKYNIDDFDKYAIRFGIGQLTGIDLPGENPGILPSPESKAILAKNNPWLDPYWYPEGDTCLTAFGQGITTVTPIQLTVISAAISNGGIFFVPTVVDKFIESDGSVTVAQAKIRDQNVVSNSVLSYVKKGMECGTTMEGVISILSTSPVKIAAKTGTAEFGFKNKEGIYEHTHAWITGYFPAENPQYSFTILLNDGKSSTNAAALLKDMVNFMYENSYISG